MRTLLFDVAALWSCIVMLSCGDSAPHDLSDSRSPSEAAGDAASARPSGEYRAEVVRVEGADKQRVYVDLAEAAVVEPDPKTQAQWDLALDGFDVFTNSGPSGSGDGAAFGPGSELDILFPTVPEVPFLRADTTAGAFVDWYVYDGSTHALYSRFHIYGIQRGERLFKLQLLGYYGEQLGAPVSALYTLRYAEVTEEGSDEIVVIEGIDATAGGPSRSDEQPSGCVALADGSQLQLTPAQAAKSKQWDLCFRRDTISVNGELGGPGETAAVDLSAAELAHESLDEVMERSADSELAGFTAVDREALLDERLEYRGDRVISALSGRWLTGSGSARELNRASWLVRGADGEILFIVVFDELEVTADGVRAVTLHVRQVEGAM